MLACSRGLLRVPPSAPVAEGAVSPEIEGASRPPVNRIPVWDRIVTKVLALGNVVLSGVPLGVVFPAYDAAVDDSAVGWTWC